MFKMFRSGYFQFLCTISTLFALFIAMSLALAFAPFGDESLVNTYTTDTQSSSAIAIDNSGNYVIVWQSNGQDGSSSGIYGQRYNAAGNRLGSEFRINTTTTNFQGSPDIWLDDNGGFVVVWMSDGQDGSGEGIYARRFNAAGVALSGEFSVNTTKVGRQVSPAIAPSSNFGFIIAWEGELAGGGVGVFVQRYSSAGIAQGGELQINTSTITTPITAVVPDIASDAVGSFVVVWTNSDTDSYGVYARRYNMIGVPQTGEFLVNTTTANNQANPQIAINRTTGFVITWQSYLQDGGEWGIYAQRYAAAGTTLGSEFRVNTFTTDIQEIPSISIDAIGDFMIAWTSLNQDGSGNGVYAQYYDVAGTPLGSEFRVNINTSDNQNQAKVALARPNGVATFTWTSAAQDGNLTGIYIRRYGESDPNIHPPAGNEFRVNTYTTSYQRLSTVAMDNNGNYVVTWESNGQDGNGWGVYAQRYNVYGTPQGNEFKVNTSTQNSELTPSIAMDAEGNFVIVWFSSGSNLDVFARRYNSAGVPQGTEINVGTMAFEGIGVDVAMRPNGDFVIVWGALASGGGVHLYAQRYNAVGTAQGSPSIVESFATPSSQSATHVAMDTVGNFVVAWTSGPQGGSDIYARRFNSAGVPLGSEFIVNTYTTGSQEYSTIGADGAGNFVITWRSYLQDGSDFGQYARRYDAVGIAQGPEFLVNTTTYSTQGLGSIAMASNGNFVITWEGGTPNYDVYAHLYNALGEPQGGEFLVNVETAFLQGVFPTVAMNDYGDFVVTYVSSIAGGSDYDVYARFFGTPPPNLSVSPLNLSYSAMQDSGLTAGQTVTISNSAPTSAAPLTFSIGSLPAWLACSAPIMNTLSAEASTTMTCQANTGSLTPQTYNGSFQITSSTSGVSGSPQTVNVAFEVTPGNPVLSVSPLSLSYSATEGTGLTTGQTVTISNGAGTGASPLTFTIGSLPSWLTCSSPSTNTLSAGTNTTISCQANPTSLTPQNYNGSFQITSSTSGVTGSPQTVNASFTVTAAPIITSITENEFYTAFEEERAASPSITQGIADFVSNGINMTVTLNTGETGRVNLIMSSGDGFVTIQIASITNLSGGVASQTYINSINQDLPALMTATLDNLVAARFGTGQDVESIVIDSTTLMLTVSED